MKNNKSKTFSIADSLLNAAALHDPKALYELGMEMYNLQHYQFAIHCLAKAIKLGNEQAEKLLEKITSETSHSKISEVMICEISPVLGTHTGPGALGISYMTGM